jgi:hypothetical protein
MAPGRRARRVARFGLRRALRRCMFAALPDTLCDDDAPSSRDLPLARLAGLIRAGASGELVARSRAGAPDETVRFLLTAGRIAWASRDGQPSEFVRHLVERGVAPVALRSALEAARGASSSLSDHLIETGLTTRAVLEGALRAQVADVAVAATRIRAPQVTFSERSLGPSSFGVLGAADVLEVIASL